MIGGVFKHLPQGGEGKKSPSQRMGLINLDQIIELIKSDQGMGLINLNQDIHSLQISRCSIMTDGKTFNTERQETQSC